MYSTLPHLRNTGIGFHIDNKAYERFEPLITASQQAKYDKHKYKYEQTEQQPILTTFGHKRSPSGDSIGRNINLAGAKLVLPAGEIPMLKPVDKNLIRPKLPPPGPPSNNGSGLLDFFCKIIAGQFLKQFSQIEAYPTDNPMKVLIQLMMVQSHHQER